MRIFMSQKRFRLLAPFTGSTVTSASQPVVFADVEVARLWHYMRVTCGHNFESYPFKRLESREFVDMDYGKMSCDIQWLCPRSPWQVQQLWSREFKAWLRTEHERMHWQSWKWHPDWEVSITAVLCCAV